MLAHPEEARHPVAVGAGGVHQPSVADLARGRPDRARPARRPAPRTPVRMRTRPPASRSAAQRGQHRLRVDHRGHPRPERPPHRARGGLDLGEPLLVEHLDPGPVRGGPPGQLVEHRELRLAPGPRSPSRRRAAAAPSPRSRRAWPGSRPGRSAPSGCPGRSRCRRGARPSCARRRAGPGESSFSRTRTSPAPRETSSRAMASPTIPASHDHHVGPFGAHGAMLAQIAAANPIKGNSPQPEVPVFRAILVEKSESGQSVRVAEVEESALPAGRRPRPGRAIDRQLQGRARHHRQGPGDPEVPHGPGHRRCGGGDRVLPRLVQARATGSS